MRLRVASLAVATLLVPASAPAAASWSAPATLGPEGGSVVDPTIAFASAGGPLISAGFRGEVAYSPGKPLQTLTRLFAGTTERARVRLVAAPVAYGGGRAAFLRQSPRDLDFGPTVTLGMSLGDVAGNPGRFRVLSRRAVPDSAAIAANDAGVVAVAWTEATTGIDGRVRLAVRRAGGRFSPAVTAASGAVGRPTGGTVSGHGVAVAVDGHGQVIVAYQRERGRARTIEARIVGRRLGKPQTLGPQRGLVDLSAAAAPGGRAVVAWGSQDVGEEANEAYRVYAAVRSGGTPRFATAQALDRGGPAIRPQGTVALAVGRDGSAVVAWSAPLGSYAAGTRSSVRVATAGAGGRFGAQRELAPSGAVGDVAIGADGAAIVVWSQLEGEQEPVDAIAALRAAGATDFGPPEAASPRERASYPAAAFDPRTGQPVVVWSATPAGAQGQVLRAAHRSG
jgi:hypothetical protein